MSKILPGVNGTDIVVSDHVANRNDGAEVYKQVFINNISGGELDISGTLSDLVVTGEVYNVKDGTSVYVLFDDQRYEAELEGRVFTCTIPAEALDGVAGGSRSIEVETSVKATLPINILGSYALTIEASMAYDVVSLATLTEGTVLGSFTIAEGYVYDTQGDTSTYFNLVDGDVVLTAAGEAAYNDTSKGLDRVTVYIYGEDGTGRTVVKRIASYISDPVPIIEPTPTLPPHLTGDWELTFQDEFTQDDIRDDHWVLKKGTAGLGYNSLESVYVEDNKVVLMTQIDPKAHDCEYEHYAGCEITTFDKFAQMYGYWESRVKYEAKRGAWPAFWLMPDRGNRGTVSQDAKVLLSFDLSSIDVPITSAVLSFGIASGLMFNNNTQEDEEVNIDGLQVFKFKSWTPESLRYEDIKQIPFRHLSNHENKKAGDICLSDLTVDVNNAVGEKYHCMIADNYRTTIRMSVAGSTYPDEDMRPVLIVNGDTVLTPYQEGSFRSGYNKYNTPEEFTTGTEVYAIFDSWANDQTTSNGGMEVDIFETLGVWGEEINAIALHWDGYGSSHKGAGSGHIDIDPSEDAYHIYGFLWEEDGFKFYIDNELAWSRSFTPDEESEDIRPFDVPAYILLSMQTGGWDGNNEQIDRENFPAKAMFDYVRVWQKVEEEEVVVE